VVKATLNGSPATSPARRHLPEPRALAEETARGEGGETARGSTGHRLIFPCVYTTSNLVLGPGIAANVLARVNRAATARPAAAGQGPDRSFRQFDPHRLRRRPDALIRRIPSAVSTTPSTPSVTRRSMWSRSTSSMTVPGWMSNCCAGVGLPTARSNGIKILGDGEPDQETHRLRFMHSAPRPSRDRSQRRGLRRIAGKNAARPKLACAFSTRYGLPTFANTFANCFKIPELKSRISVHPDRAGHLPRGSHDPDPRLERRGVWADFFERNATKEGGGLLGMYSMFDRWRVGTLRGRRAGHHALHQRHDLFSNCSRPSCPNCPSWAREEGGGQKSFSMAGI